MHSNKCCSFGVPPFGVPPFGFHHHFKTFWWAFLATAVTIAHLKFTEQNVVITESTMDRRILNIWTLNICTIWYIYDNLSEWRNEWRRTQWMHIVARDRTCILTFKDRYLEDETDTFVQITVHNRVYICVVFVQITLYM